MDYELNSVYGNYVKEQEYTKYAQSSLETSSVKNGCIVIVGVTLDNRLLGAHLAYSYPNGEGGYVYPFDSSYSQISPALVTSLTQIFQFCEKVILTGSTDNKHWERIDFSFLPHLIKTEPIEGNLTILIDPDSLVIFNDSSKILQV
jgi:hypothetical protein